MIPSYGIPHLAGLSAVGSSVFHMQLPICDHPRDSVMASFVPLCSVMVPCIPVFPSLLTQL